MESTEFTGAGIVFMILTWGSILSLTAYCFYKTLWEDRSKIIGTLEVEAEIDEEEKYE
ncbi:MAG: hypothetical protein ACQEQ4_02145 [Fibrobacterota bacterium]